MTRWVCGLSIFVAALLYSQAAIAHGVVGDYVFLEPLITQDPTPANELDILGPSWVRSSDANTYAISSSIEKVLYLDDNHMPRVSAGVGTNWSHASTFEGPSRDGWDDLDMFAKFSPYYSLEHEFLISFVLQVQVPVGNQAVEEQNHTSVGPAFLWEKGMGDLPNWKGVKYLRPFGIQSDFGYLPAVGGHTSHNMVADATIEYSLPYLSNNVKDIGLKWPLRNLYLFNEINYDQLITGPSGETFPSLLATPGIAYVSYHFELSIGTQFALNQASVSENHAAVLGLLDIFYDSIFTRAGNWTINKGFGQ
jgi:hypothetical protein